MLPVPIQRYIAPFCHPFNRGDQLKDTHHLLSHVLRLMCSRVCPQLGEPPHELVDMLPVPIQREVLLIELMPLLRQRSHAARVVPHPPHPLPRVAQVRRQREVVLVGDHEGSEPLLVLTLLQHHQRGGAHVHGGAERRPDAAQHHGHLVLRVVLVWLYVVHRQEPPQGRRFVGGEVYERCQRAGQTTRKGVGKVRVLRSKSHKP
mmetsp:Transcript_67583/g.166990  ORF Transcript_67583/g.166990 Transcript_67583/m.166990 type:complete len:204 (+) Transcript_67583:196-807(+)